MKSVYCLYRVSTKGQVDKNDIPLQKIECRKFAENQGWIITKEFSEKGVSGFKVSADDRDAIQDLKTAALNKEFDVLLVFMFDRLGRRDDETPFVVEWFSKQGIEVWSTQEGEQRFDNQVDKLTNYIRFWQAASESAKTSTRIKTRMQQLITDGCYTGGTLPYGYKLVHKGRMNKKGAELYDIEIDDEESEIVREIFSKTISDGYGSHRMSSYLNDKGIKTHGGSKFQCNTINRILANKMYCGYLKTKNAISQKLDYLVIIEENVYNQAQYILKQRSTKYKDDRQIAYTTRGQSMLSGNIYCGHCGGRLTVTRYQDRYTRKDGSEYVMDQLKYTCYHKSRKLCECDGQTSYIAETIDNTIFEIMKDLFSRIKDAPEEKAVQRKFKSQMSAHTTRQKKLNAELEKHNKQLETLQMEIANSLIGESIYTPADLNQAIKTIKLKITDAEQGLQEVEQELNEKSITMSSIGATYNMFKLGKRI